MRRPALSALLNTNPLTTHRGPDDARRRRRSAAARVCAFGAVPALAAAAAVAVIVPVGGPGARTQAAPAADAQTVFTLDGHGHGHGRGMGQWGAYGYAMHDGWDADRILGHFYPDTELARSGPDTIRVRIQGLDGQDPQIRSDAPMTVGGRDIPVGQAVTLHPVPGGAEVTVADGCGGAPGDTFTAADATVRSDGSTLNVCGGNTYRGDLGVALDGGDARTVNTVAMGDYLRGVVPDEIPASWGDEGAMEALRAQAVAARSYASTEHRYGYADTCDTQSCQMYDGTAEETPNTDEAVSSTAGTVVTRGGQPVSTEFSASTGGWTAGGDFRAVEDEGDAASPDHDWTQTVTAQQVSDAFGVGPLESMAVTERNGLGADGGRVVTLHVVGADGTVDVPGPKVRSKLGLKSDWFTIEGQDSEAEVVPPPSGTGSPDESPGAGDAHGDEFDIVGGAGVTAEDIRTAADALGKVPAAAGMDPRIGDAIGSIGDIAARGLQAYKEARAAAE